MNSKLPFTARAQPTSRKIKPDGDESKRMTHRRSDQWWYDDASQGNEINICQFPSIFAVSLSFLRFNKHPFDLDY